MDLNTITIEQLSNGLIRIGRHSPLSGKVSYMDLPITRAQVTEFCSGVREGTSRKIQQIFPNLNADQREFIKTGYTPEDLVAIFTYPSNLATTK